MKKKQLKWYDAPTVEVVELDVKTSLLAGSGEGSNPGTGSGDGDFEWEFE